MKTTGEHYERLAARWLEARGLTIISRNYSCKAGEIDLIARDGRHLVFIEVRARSNPRYASAAGSVDKRKQLRLLRTARHYLQQQPLAGATPCRFDVITFEPRQSPAGTVVRWIRSAFTD